MTLQAEGRSEGSDWSGCGYRHDHACRQAGLRHFRLACRVRARSDFRAHPRRACLRTRSGSQGRPQTKDDTAKLRLAMAAMGNPRTNVGDLCRELGITRSTLYRHVSPTGQPRADTARRGRDPRDSARRPMRPVCSDVPVSGEGGASGTRGFSLANTELMSDLDHSTDLAFTQRRFR